MENSLAQPGKAEWKNTRKGTNEGEIIFFFIPD
jgi:hypothetical protein